MGSITQVKRVDKTSGKSVTIFRAYVRREGYASKSKVCATKTEAKNWIRENEAGVTLTKGKGGKTLALLIEDFIKAPPTRGTKYWADSHLDFWIAQLGAMKVGGITRGDINGAVASLQVKMATKHTPTGLVELGTKITPATVNRYMASLSSVLNYALNNGIIENHPMKGGKVKKLQESNGRTRILSPAEEAKLMDAAMLSSWPSLHLFVRMCLTTAARKGEVLNLKWRDLRLDESVAVLGKTKNGRPRALPLVDDVRVALENASKVRALGSDYVFYDPKDPSKPYNVDSVWKTCRDAAGLLNDREDKLDRVVLHTTRHTGVTKMLKGGANLAQVAAVSGHQTLAMLKRYEHLAAADAVELAQRLLSGHGSK